MASRQTRSGNKKTRGTTARSRNGGGKSRASAPPPAHIKVIWSIPLFGLGLLFASLLFVEGAALWQTVRRAFFGVFGIGMYPLALIWVYIALLIAIRKPIGRAIAKSVMLEVFWCATPVVFSALDLTEKNALEIIQLLYAHGTENWWTGGAFGAVVGGSLVAFCGRPAANIILVIALLIVLMVLFTITPADLVDFIRGFAAVEQTPSLVEPESYEPRDEWEERHAESAIRRSEARDRAAERHRERREQQAANRQEYARRIQRRFDVDLGPDSPPEPPASAAAQPTSPAASAAAAQPGLPAASAAAYQPPHTQMPFEIGPGGTFGMHAFDPLPEKPQNVTVPAFDDEEDDLQPAGDDFSTSIAPGQTEEDGVETASMAEMEAAQGSLFPEPEARTSAALPEQPAGSAAAAADPQLDSLIQKAVEAPALSEAAAGALPEPQRAPVPDYRYPPIELFEEAQDVDDSEAVQEMRHNADVLVSTLDSFGVKTRILDICRGPSVTRYELQPQAGVKISRITSLADDIALNLAAAGVRIEAPIPGKPAVGIEVPNRVKTPVGIRGLLESQNYTKSASPLTMALGRDIAGSAQVADLCKMPHLLIAGSTGSGKSVCVNSILISFLFKASPEDLRLILIDPKVVELAEYNGIPHLLMPVVTEPKKASGALGAAVAEMERRYQQFAENNVREIKSFNRKAAVTPGMKKMPYIAIVIDELADLMMVSGKEVEDYICRIAQKARAAGMHLIVATQRPSVDVVTGLIKANIPSRIAFAVSSQVDSRTILDGAGAEKLLGMGDMLFLPIGANKPIRVQGAYVKDEEIEACLSYIKETTQAQYDEALISEVERLAAQSGSNGKGGSSAAPASDEGEGRDPMFEAAVEAVIEAGMASTSLLQRRCKLGYARAARIMDEMEQEGVIGPFEGAKPRKVLYTKQQWQERKLRSDNTAPAQEDFFS